MTKLPRIHLKLYKNDGEVQTFNSLKKRRILSKVKADNFLKARLRVVYGKDKGELVTNEITGNIDDIKWGLEAFMDKSLFLTI